MPSSWTSTAGGSSRPWLAHASTHSEVMVGPLDELDSTGADFHLLTFPLGEGFAALRCPGSGVGSECDCTDARLRWVLAGPVTVGCAGLA